MRKSLVGMYIQFFDAEDTVELEKTLRKLVKQKRFPPFYKLIVMVDHNKNSRDNMLIKTPFIISKDDLIDEV